MGKLLTASSHHRWEGSFWANMKIMMDRKEHKQPEEINYLLLHFLCLLYFLRIYTHTSTETPPELCAVGMKYTVAIHSSSCYSHVAPWLNPDFWLETLLWETQGSASKAVWSDCECMMCGAPVGSLELSTVKGIWSQLKWCRCDCQSGSWTVRWEYFLRRYSDYMLWSTQLYFCFLRSPSL